MSTAAMKVPTEFTAVDKFSSVVRKMTKGVSKFSKKGVSAVQRFDNKVTKTWNKLGKLSRLGLGLGAGFIAKDAINIVKNYEQANADLAAVMNTTAANQKLLSKDAERLGSITSKSATEVVGLQEAFARLGFETPEIINMTEATISGSVAMNAELARTAELTGAVIKTFDDFTSVDASSILDKMTLSTQKSALNFEKLETALPIVSGAANAAGVPFEKLLALMGKLSDAGIDASSSSTALRNIFLDSAKKGHNYQQILGNIQKNQSKLTAANDAFGKRGAISAVVLAGKLQEVDTLTKTLTEDFKGTAAAAESKRLNTFGGSLELLKSAYEGLLLKTNESSGALSILQSVIEFVTRNIETIALVIVSLIGVFAALKVAIFTIKAVTLAYNVVLGIQTALTQTNKRAIIGNTVAQNAYKVAMAITTAVTWLANSAFVTLAISILAATWPILAIIAAVAAIIAIFYYWDEIVAWFSKKWEQFTGWISGLWEKVVGFFKDFDFMAFFKNIGKSILNFLLMPLKGLLMLLSKIPGKVGELAQLGLDKLGDVTGEITAKTETEPLESPETSQANATRESNANVNGSIDLNIKDKGNNVDGVSTSDSGLPINVTPTQGAF